MHTPFFRLWLTAFLMAGLLNIINAQSFPNIQVSDFENPSEVSITFAGADTNKLCAGANIDNVYYSADGGRTWLADKLVSSHGVFGDPVLITDTNGHFYYFHLAQNDSILIWPMWADRMVCQKSTDGVNWSDGTYTGLNLPKMQDKEWAAADPQTNYIAVTWTEFDEYASVFNLDSTRILFSISKDGGQTWSAAKVISALSGNCLDEDETIEGAVPAFGLNGEIYVAWSFNDSIYFTYSTDTGNTWLPREIAIAAQPEGWDYDIPGLYRANGFPVLLVDYSNTPNRGNLYLNWTDKRSGANDCDVFFMKSTNGGQTWGTPVRVNDDAPGKENFLSWMTVDPTDGNIYVVFYDRRNHADHGTDVYLANSTNGGATFSNHLISNTPFYPTDSVFLGDYIGITAHHGSIRPAWMRTDNGLNSIWTAIVYKSALVQSSATNMQSKPAFALVSPNPTKAEVIVQHHHNSEVEVTVTDLSGKLLYRSQAVQPATFVNFSLLGIAQGLYLVNCRSGAQQQTYKVVYLK